MIIPVFFLALLLSFTPSNKARDAEAPPLPPSPPPRNIILMIGDGMGLAQISAGMYLNGNKLNLERFPAIGFHKAYSADDLAAGPAAAATAIASGVKTYNGAIGMTRDSMPAFTILEEAEARGLATGLVSTSSMTDATPASFIAHVKLCEMAGDIAAHFLNTEIDLVIGGGKKHFGRQESGQHNLYEELEKKGYYVSDYSKEELSGITPMPQKNFVYFTADTEPLPASQGRDYLPLASGMAARFLHSRGGQAGFFLMVGGAQISRGGQANDSDYIVSEMIDFDKAIGEVLKFAERDGQTLVIVTGGQETGGYAINPGSRMDSIFPDFTTDKPTASLIPVFAYGPGAELFKGIYENTAIYEKMRAALGWGKQPGH